MNQGSNKKEKGFTLIELLIAISIFATFMIVVTMSLSSVLKSERKAEVLRSTQESTRYIVEMIAREARVANGEMDDGGVRIGHAYLLSSDGKELSIVNTVLNSSNIADSIVKKNTYSLSNDGELVLKSYSKKIGESAFANEETKILSDKNEMIIKTLSFDLNPSPTDLSVPPELNLKVEAVSTKGEQSGQSEDTAKTTLETSISPRNY